MNFLSFSDRSLLKPAEKPSSVHAAGIGYIMIDLGSIAVALTSAGSTACSTLNSICSTDQLFGGWDKAQKTHFADGGVFDQIYTNR